jgi:hypothetical protein
VTKSSLTLASQNEIVSPMPQFHCETVPHLCLLLEAITTILLTTSSTSWHTEALIIIASTLGPVDLTDNLQRGHITFSNSSVQFCYKAIGKVNGCDVIKCQSYGCTDSSTLCDVMAYTAYRDSLFNHYQIPLTDTSCLFFCHQKTIASIVSGWVKCFMLQHDDLARDFDLILMTFGLLSIPPLYTLRISQ